MNRYTLWLCLAASAVLACDGGGGEDQQSGGGSDAGPSKDGGDEGGRAGRGGGPAEADGGGGSPAEADGGGGSGGTTGGADAGGGDAGEGGAQPGRCDEQCAAAEDCGVGYECGSDKHCACIDDEMCTAALFGFHTPGCTNDDDCEGDTCVRWAGGTYCASVDGDGFALCLSPNGDRLSLERADSPVEDPEIVVKCHSGHPIRCNSETKLCEFACADDGDCAFEHPGMRTCDVDTGRCVCTIDETEGDSCNPETGYQCRADGQCGCAEDGRCDGYSWDGPYCNVETAECECRSHADCEHSAQGSYCLNGKCGCRSADECTLEKRFSGTSFACVPE